MHKRFIAFLLFFISLASYPVILMAQEDQEDSSDVSDLESMLETEESGMASKKAYTASTFKTTRIANGHSIENTAKGVLDFRINHRFGQLDEGLKNFFGLDNAVTRIGADYGITDWLMIGIGRSTHLRDYDGFAKVKILRQTDDNTMPVSLSYLGSISIQDNDVTIPAGSDYPFSNRIAYVNQLLIARKFSNWLSLQLMPTHIHYNFVQYNDEPNDVLAIGLGGRIKLSNRIALTGEYYYLLPDNKLRDTRNSLTLGFDIETGGHVFQLMFTNSTGINERTAIGQTTGRWDKGDVHFGFNISRIFTIVRPKEFKNSRNKIW